MMHLIARKRCAKRNPRVSAALGLLSAVMIGFGAYLTQHEEIRTPVALAIGLGILAVGIAVIRFVAISRDGGRP
ncbi:MAG: hypothetical protein EOP61_09630 [Sphingomonadales bacterium]|nr:MAG: hypothetical protein EOP61_09630 [Sphingomonadales bacterium]